MMRSLRSLETSPITRAVFWLAMGVIAMASAQHIVALMLAVADGNTVRIGLDYRAFAAAGELVKSGNGDALYQPTSTAFLAVGPVAFVYPPWVALFMVPWSLLPVNVGLAVWTVFGLVVMVAGLRACGVRDWRPLMLAMVSFPALFALGLGQSTFLFVGIVAFAVAAMRREQVARSGVCLAVAGWKPHLLGGFVVLWLADPRRWWRQALGAVATTIVLVVISAIALPGAWRAWISFLLDSVNDLASAVMEASVAGMVSLLIGSLSPVRWVVVGLVAIVLISSAVGLLRRRAASLEVALALAFGAWLLIAPHVVVYDVLILVVPLSIAFETRLRRDVVVAGMLLAVGLSIGPRVTQMQLDAWGRAVNPSTVSLLLAVAMFMYWGWSGGPFFVGGVSIGAGSSSAGCDDAEAP